MAAVESAGDFAEMNDDLAHALIDIVRDRTEPEELRAAAAISLGPVLEECDMEGFEEEDELFRPPISEDTYRAIQTALREVHDSADDAKLVRRRALEAAVRAPADWQPDAVRAAYAAADPEWKMTAVFTMHYVPGFDNEILASLDDPDPEVRFEAIRAAGSRDLPAAWPKIHTLLVPPSGDRDLLLAAIEAAPFVSPSEAQPILFQLSESDDAEIAEAAEDALSFIDIEREED
jgi:hypothetical protein